MWKELIKKIELQSVLVLFITLLFGFLLLNKDDNLSTPAGILGSISIVIGLLYTFGSFFSNQIKESYRDVIAEYKSTIISLRSVNKDIRQSYKDDRSFSRTDNKNVGSYRTTSEADAGTSDS